MYKISLILFSCLSTYVTVFAQKKVDPDFHLYILMGQSNMAGRGPITPELKDDGDPNLFMLDANGAWILAKNPIHFDKPSVVGVGPGMAFGKAMAKANPKVKIGLIPCAVGGTAIESWQPNGYDAATKTHPYDDALLRIHEAMKKGVIKGVIWHQGEANSSEKKVLLYLAQLDSLVKRVRTEVGNKQLPVVVGELGRFKDSYQSFNQQLQQVPAIIPFTAVASSEGLIDKGDLTHFNGSSANLLGERFAAKMLELQKRKK